MRFGWSALVVEGIYNNVRIEQTGTGHLFGFPLILDLFKPLGRFLTHVLDPLIRAFGQLGMVLVLPTPRGFAECVALLATPDFPFHQIYNKSGALLLAGNLVDCRRKLSRNRNKSTRFAHTYFKYNMLRTSVRPQRKPH